mmetsp:Transcript_2090/g.2853  ORF Transcript_2090/g.2853 Transcript_2090/m.2853 type:complete len:748 (-) Transcript_2090:26-2269(-)
MDPVILLSMAYSLYENINNNLKTVIKNNTQFLLLGRRIDELAGPIKRLQDIHKSTKKLQCTDKALVNLIDTLESIKVFVSQPRFQKPDGDKASNLLHFISQMYHASEDNESFAHFDKLLSNNLRSLNLGITVSIFDYVAAAARDDEAIFVQSGLKSKPELRQIDLARLQWDSNNISNILGQGAFSVVWRGKYESQSVAIKQVLNSTILSPKDTRIITKEALLMQFSDHVNVLKVLGVCLPKGLLVMELALCSLSEYLYRTTASGDAATAQKLKLAPVDSILMVIDKVSAVRWKLEIILQICDALQYLHRFHILHRDIKSPNVMLFHDTSRNKVIAKIGDFGLALAVDLITRTSSGNELSKMAILPNAVGTCSYMAPELFECQPGGKVAYSESSDVYSLGILINEIMSGTMPWGGGARELHIMDWVKIKSLRPEMWVMSKLPSPAEKELFAIVGSSDSVNPSCLHQSHYRRPTAYDVFIAATGGSDKPLPSPTKESLSDLKKSSKKYEPVRVLEEVIITIIEDDKPMIQRFVGDLLVRYNDVSAESMKNYAESLFRLSVTTCDRFEQQLREKNKQARNGAVKWLKSLAFHEYDIADMVEKLSTPPTAGLLSREQVLELQGVPVLEKWLKSEFSTINVDRNRIQWAQLLWDNNITTVRRLLKYGDDLKFLKSIGIIGLDAQDISSYVLAEKKRPIKEKAVKHQWTSKAQNHNLDAMAFVGCCAPCCSRVMSPYYVNCCLCFIPQLIRID